MPKRVLFAFWQTVCHKMPSVYSSVLLSLCAHSMSTNHFETLGCQSLINRIRIKLNSSCPPTPSTLNPINKDRKTITKFNSVDYTTLTPYLSDHSPSVEDSLNTSQGNTQRVLTQLQSIRIGLRNNTPSHPPRG